MFVKDLLFATLDPTMRLIKLPCGAQVILSDTVGFISELPHDLVASFRATLEEVQSADIVLHLCDLASVQFNEHGGDVKAILAELGVTEETKPILQVWNKIDALDSDVAKEYIEKSANTKNSHICSVVTGDGVDSLLRKVSDVLHANDKCYQIVLELSAGAENAWIKYKSRMINEEYDEDGGNLNSREYDEDGGNLNSRNVF